VAAKGDVWRVFRGGGCRGYSAPWLRGAFRGEGIQSAKGKVTGLRLTLDSTKEKTNK